MKKFLPVFLILVLRPWIAEGATEAVALDLTTHNVKNAIINFTSANTVDFSGATVDFTGATVTGLVGGGSGSVTSVGIAAPNIFSVSGSPVTTTGTLTLSLATQSANRIFAGPSTGSAAAPTFRALVAADIPDLSGVYQPADADLDTWATKTPFAGTFTLTTGKTFNVTNTLTLSGTDGSTLNIGSGGTLGTAAYTSSSSYVASSGTLALGGFASITGRIGNANLPLGAQLYDTAGTPKLDLDVGARKGYGPDGTTEIFSWDSTDNFSLCGGKALFRTNGEFHIVPSINSQALNIAQTWSGTTALPPSNWAYNDIQVTDSFDAGDPSTFMSVLNIGHTVTGAGYKGSRMSLQVALNKVYPLVNEGNDSLAGGFTVNITGNSAGTVGAPLGGGTAFSGNIDLSPSNSTAWWGGVNVGEFNVSVRQGHVRDKTIFHLANGAYDAVNGTRLDAMLSFSGQTSVGWNYALLFSDVSGAEALKSTSWILGYQNVISGTIPTIAGGFDLSGWTVTGPLIKGQYSSLSDSAGMAVGGGTITAAGIGSNVDITLAPKGTGGVVVNTGNILGATSTIIKWNNDTGIARSAAGVTEINDGTAGQWGGLKLGTRDSGTTNVANGLTLGHQSTATPAVGFGEGILYNLNSSTTADQNAARTYAAWTTATHASRTSKYVVQTVNNAGSLTDAWTVFGNGDGSLAGALTAYSATSTAVGAPGFTHINAGPSWILLSDTSTGGKAWRVQSSLGATGWLGLYNATDSVQGPLYSPSGGLVLGGGTSVNPGLGNILLTGLTASSFLETDANKILVSKTAAQMRTDLSLVIGTNVQAWDADLDTWAAKTPYSGTLTITSGKTLNATNTITLSGTDSTTMTFPSTSATLARTDAANTFTGHQTIEGVTSTGATGTGKFVFDASPALTGTPTAPTAAINTSTTQVATTAFATSQAGHTITITFDGSTSSWSPTIPSGFNHARITYQGRTTAAVTSENIGLRFATGGGGVDTGTNYEYQLVRGTGGAVSQPTPTTGVTFVKIGAEPGTSSSANYPGTSTAFIHNFAGATFYKTITAVNSFRDGTTDYTDTITGTWKNTGAITTITMIAITGNFANGSVASITYYQ